MASNYQVNGVDLSTLFDPIGSTTKIADVGYQSGGVDISNIFAGASNGDATYNITTNIQSGGTDIKTLFAGWGTTNYPGALWGQGANIYGELGTNNTTAYSSIVQTISGGTNWKQVFMTNGGTGAGTTAAIKTDGTLWMWGTGTVGVLGNNSTVSRSSPVQTAAGGTNWKQVSVLGSTTHAIKTDGTLWAWGDGSSGTLGDGTTVSKSSPVQIGLNTNWKQVCGPAAIKTDGTLWLWGANVYGTIGDGTAVSKSSPVQTSSGGTNWKQVSHGQQHVAAIKTDGTLWLWGSNIYGELGNGSTGGATGVSTPTQILGGGTNWKSVACGGATTIAIKTDGTLWAWGRNQSGQLGTNDLVNRSSPTQITGGGTTWKLISCGIEHISAIKSDGTLWGCGPGLYIGGTNGVNYSSPIQSAYGGTSWKSIASGSYGTMGIQ